jgi:hypothetical protein
MTIYNIHYTNKNKATINVDETEINTSATDLKFFGRRRLQYGEDMNQNILFILEHFACPENMLNPGNPDLTIAANSTNTHGGTDFTPLTHPTDGQMWYNSTQQRLFYYNATSTKWVPVGMQDDVAANWGIIYHGQQLPQPISSKTGYVFPYSECSWIVSPYQFPQQIDYMLVDTDASATVSSLYSLTGDPSILKGFATYLIVGIKGNKNLGSLTPIPSNTPTPALTQTPSTTPASTPPVTPTNTPVATPTYTGPLVAYFGPRFPFTLPFVAGNGTTQPYYAGDYRRVKYPGITSTKYKILYSATAPAPLHTVPVAPHNPWDNVSGNYYLYVSNTPASGTLGPFYSLSALYNQIVFVSGKSTESGTQQTEGVDGAFFRVAGITNLGTYTQIQLSVVPLAPIDTSLYGHPPIQTSPIDLLAFNYDYLYATGAFYTTNPSLVVGDPQALFYLTPPTQYAGAFDLYIQGGHPPYTVTDIKYFGPQGNGVFSGFSSNKIPSLIATGFTPTGNQNLPAPVSFTDLTTATATKPLFVGPVNFPSTNPNIQQIANGYVVRSYATADFNYSTDFASKYGTACQPEWLWHVNYPGEGSSCANLTGNTTTYCFDSACVVIQDSVGTVAIAPLYYGGDFQTIDRDFMNQTFAFNPNVTGPNPGSIISAAGTYTYNIGVSLGMTPTSIRPLSSPAQLQYTFSLLSSNPTNTTPSAPGDFQYTTTGSLLPRPTTNCIAVSGTTTMIHTGCDISNVNPDLQCPSSGGYFGGYGQGRLIPGTSHQTITITQVWNNLTNAAQSIASTPITVTFSVLNSPNTYNWSNLLGDRTAQHTGSFTTPYVPNNMKIDVQIPAGLNFPGTLVIPFHIGAYDNPNGGCAFGAATALSSVTLNFSNTA